RHQTWPRRDGHYRRQVERPAAGHRGPSGTLWHTTLDHAHHHRRRTWLRRRGRRTAAAGHGIVYYAGAGGDRGWGVRPPQRARPGNTNRHQYFHRPAYRKWIRGNHSMTAQPITADPPLQQKIRVVLAD